MSVKIINQIPSDDLILNLNCNGEKTKLHVSSEAFEDYYNITDSDSATEKLKQQEDLTAKLFIYLSTQESTGRLMAKYDFLTVTSLQNVIGAK